MRCFEIETAHFQVLSANLPLKGHSVLDLLRTCYILSTGNIQLSVWSDLSVFVCSSISINCLLNDIFIF